MGRYFLFRRFLNGGGKQRRLVSFYIFFFLFLPPFLPVSRLRLYRKRISKPKLGLRNNNVHRYFISSFSKIRKTPELDPPPQKKKEKVGKNEGFEGAFRIHIIDENQHKIMVEQNPHYSPFVALQREREQCERQASYHDLTVGRPYLGELKNGMQNVLSIGVR